MIDYRLYLVTDDPSRYTGDWIENVVASVEGGVTCVQYRDTESAADERYARVRRLQDALRKYGTPIIVNNDVELAAAVKAEGVHVGQSDMPPEQVRVIVGKGCEIGLSITDVGQLKSVDRSCVDCLGIGPVFDARKTKADASAAMGVGRLSAIVKVVGCGLWDESSRGQEFKSSDGHVRAARWSAPTDGLLSTVAIGGITLENAEAVLATGVGGLAVVSAFSKAEDPFAVAKKFRRFFK